MGIAFKDLTGFLPITLEEIALRPDPSRKGGRWMQAALGEVASGGPEQGSRSIVLIADRQGPPSKEVVPSIQERDGPLRLQPAVLGQGSLDLLVFAGQRGKERESGEGHAPQPRGRARPRHATQANRSFTIGPLEKESLGAINLVEGNDQRVAGCLPE